MTDHHNSTFDMNRMAIAYSPHSHHSTTTSDYHRGRPPSRPPSEMLCEIHVYKVPPQLWRGSYNNILNNVVTDTISLGIVRVPTELRLVELREEIAQQLQLDDLLPRDYAFLRSVGRSLTTLRAKQEYALKAKHFLPPMAPSPEIYILEVTSDIREALAISDRSSQSPVSRRTSPSHRGYNNAYRNGYSGIPENGHSGYYSRQPNSPVNKFQPLPQIDIAPNRSHSSETHPYYYPDPPSSYTQQNSNNTSHNQNQTHQTTPTNDNTNKNLQSPPKQEMKSHVIVKEAQQVNQDPKSNQTHNPAKQTPPPWPADKSRDRRPDDDSGMAGFTSDDEHNRRNRDDYNNRGARRLESEKFTNDEETEAERRQRLDDLESRNYMDKDRWDSDRDERLKLAQEDRRREEEDKRRKEDHERRAREDEERRKKEEEEGRRKEEEERRRREEERRKEENESQRLREEKERQEEEEKQRDQYKNMSSPEPEPERDTESARQQRKNEKEQLLRDLQEARAARQAQEREREELVKRAKGLQHKTTNRRNDARDLWKKRYFEEKKRTAPLEENSNRLRQELEALHRRLMNTLEGPKEKNQKTFEGRPSEKTNYVIQCTRLQHDIEDIQRRVENAKMKLTAEMKLRNQAEGELRALRAELTQKKTTINRTRQQQLAAMKPQLKESVQGEREIDISHVSDPNSSYQPSHSSRILRAF